MRLCAAGFAFVFSLIMIGAIFAQMYIEKQYDSFINLLTFIFIALIAGLEVCTCIVTQTISMMMSRNNNIKIIDMNECKDKHDKNKSQ